MTINRIQANETNGINSQIMLIINYYNNNILLKYLCNILYVEGLILFSNSSILENFDFVKNFSKKRLKLVYK